MGLGQDFPKRLHGIVVVRYFRNNQIASGWLVQAVDARGRRVLQRSRAGRRSRYGANQITNEGKLENFDFCSHKICQDSLQKTSITKKPSIAADKDVPHNMGRKDVIRATDFNFLMVLGKGSFGKVLFAFFCVFGIDLCGFAGDVGGAERHG